MNRPSCPNPDDIPRTDLSVVPESDPPLHRWFVTFGQRYREHYHPELPAVIHPDGWVTIIAPDELTARKMTIAVLGVCWCGIYSESDFDPEHYPDGELACFRVVTTDYSELPTE